MVSKGLRFWCFFLGPLLFLPIILAGREFWRSVVRTPESQLLAIGICATLFASALPIYFFPHYAGPAAPIVVAFVVLAFRHIEHRASRDHYLGAFVVRAIPVSAVILLMIATFSSYLGVSLPGTWPDHFGFWCSPMAPFHERADVLKSLKSMEGQQLVIVRYRPEHDTVKEWVYNNADIDSAKVVWARDMTSTKNEELIRYFANRKVWLLEADEKPPRLGPYSAAPQFVSQGQ